MALAVSYGKPIISFYFFLHDCGLVGKAVPKAHPVDIMVACDQHW